MFNAVLVDVDYFQDIYYRILSPLTINIFKDDENLLPNVTFHTKLLDRSGLMSESQQRPEICDVISRKRYWKNTKSRKYYVLFVRVSQSHRQQRRKFQILP